MEITYITSNPNKAKQLSRHFHLPIHHQSIDLPEIQSLDIEEVVREKARAAYNIVKKPVLVEDFSLQCHVLGKLPGPLIKWFLQEIGTAGLCKLLNKYIDRSATATIAVALYDGNEVSLFRAETKGMIAPEPRGQEVYGTDAIFIPEGHQKTWSEMTDGEQKASYPVCNPIVGEN